EGVHLLFREGRTPTGRPGGDDPIAHTHERGAEDGALLRGHRQGSIAQRPADVPGLLRQIGIVLRLGGALVRLDQEKKAGGVPRLRVARPAQAVDRGGPVSLFESPPSFLEPAVGHAVLTTRRTRRTRTWTWRSGSGTRSRSPAGRRCSRAWCR